MIRSATLDDLQSVKACAEAAYGVYVERIGGKPPPMTADFQTLIEKGAIYLLLNETGFVGFVIFYPRGDHLHIESIAIDPAAQRKGFGKKLIAFVEEKARQAGLSAVELYTHRKMTENIAYYPALGYRETGRHARDGIPRVFFRKEF